MRRNVLSTFVVIRNGSAMLQEICFRSLVFIFLHKMSSAWMIAILIKFDVRFLAISHFEYIMDIGWIVSNTYFLTHRPALWISFAYFSVICFANKSVYVHSLI